MAEQNSNVLNEPTNCEPQDDEEDELETIWFKKWQAPYSLQGGDTTYHNALVYGAEPGKQLSDMSPIEVHALFINPIHKAMMPCPNYLKGACKYTSHLCHYSHGEVVLQSRLREYREPDFSLIKPGYRVLVQHLDKLWHPAIVCAIHDNSLCYIKLESNGTRLEVELHNVMPLGDDASDLTESSSKCENEPIPEPILVEPVEEIPEAPPSPPLECWEIPIKGVGWRLMARMGYVTGTGLGKHRDGRVSPVKADILPRGKSLDHCMLLREHAGVDENLLEVDRRLGGQSRYEAQQRARRTQQQLWGRVQLGRKNGRERQIQQQQNGITSELFRKQVQLLRQQSVQDMEKQQQWNGMIQGKLLRERVQLLRQKQKGPERQAVKLTLQQPKDQAGPLIQAQNQQNQQKSTTEACTLQPSEVGGSESPMEETQRLLAEHKQLIRTHRNEQRRLNQKLKRLRKKARNVASVKAEQESMEQELWTESDSDEDDCILLPEDKGGELKIPQIPCTSAQNQDAKGIREEQRRLLREKYREDLAVSIECVELD